MPVADLLSIALLHSTISMHSTGDPILDATRTLYTFRAASHPASWKGTALLPLYLRPLAAPVCVRVCLIFPVSPLWNSSVKERGSVSSQGGTRPCFLMRISTLTRQARISHRTVTVPLWGWDFHMLGKKEKVRGRKTDSGGGVWGWRAVWLKKKRNKNGLFVHWKFWTHMKLCRGLEMKGTFEEDLFRETIWHVSAALSHCAPPPFFESNLRDCGAANWPLRA